MERYTLAVAPSTRWIRLLLTHGPDEIFRALLPPSRSIRQDRVLPMMIEALAQWVDAPIHVVLSAAAQDVSFCLGLTDELGCGTRSLFYDVEVVERGARRRRGTRIRGIGDFTDLRQLHLVTTPPGRSR
jgi:hypothetical protein